MTTEQQFYEATGLCPYRSCNKAAYRDWKRTITKIQIAPPKGSNEPETSVIERSIKAGTWPAGKKL